MIELLQKTTDRFANMKIYPFVKRKILEVGTGVGESL